ncbi:MAG: DUF1501 domain-containing protein [Planctomycetaceae bacterium]|nr:DUF1501 domain-containing protein [Planctomycetaceae bacterium]
MFSRSLRDTGPLQNRRALLRGAAAGTSTALMGGGRLLSVNAGETGTIAVAHRPAKARSVIFLFMAGGPSQLETFDPKPLLNRLHGQPRPASFGEAKYQFVQSDARLMGTKRRFRRCGESGIEVSDLFPRMARCIDEFAVIRSCTGDQVVHSAAQYELFSGRTVPGFPSMGSWTLYGLGSESDALPSYVVLPDPLGALEAGQPMYMNGFLPATFQPTMFRPGDQPVLNLDLPSGVDRSERQQTLRLIQQLNAEAPGPFDDELQARRNAYLLADRMQTHAPEVFDLQQETKETQDLYGIGHAPTDDYGRRCLLARRLVEHGVRFVCVVSGGGPGNMQWDAHSDIEENHLRKTRETDQPVAALITDLKRRGLLDETLILWGGEFGRSPEAQGSRGRDHHNLGFTMLMAGGGIRGGRIEGATDEIGLRAIESPHHFRDVHATLLHQLGLDQHHLTWQHQGRDERLTFLEGHVIESII